MTELRRQRSRWGRAVRHWQPARRFRRSQRLNAERVVYDQAGNAQPRPATEWAWSPDYLELSVQLRPGVKFHTGRPFTSTDARFNLERVRDPSVGSQLQNGARLTQVSTPAPDQSS